LVSKILNTKITETAARINIEKYSQAASNGTKTVAKEIEKVVDMKPNIKMRSRYTIPVTT
jgi:hypothetical protein